MYLYVGKSSLPRKLTDFCVLRLLNPRFDTLVVVWNIQQIHQQCWNYELCADICSFSFLKKKKIYCLLIFTCVYKIRRRYERILVVAVCQSRFCINWRAEEPGSSSTEFEEGGKWTVGLSSHNVYYLCGSTGPFSFQSLLPFSSFCQSELQDLSGWFQHTCKVGFFFFFFNNFYRFTTYNVNMRI